MQAATNRQTPTLWAITSYFNPSGYKNRLKNYRIFRQKLTVPLATVELSYGSDFELHPGDADILIQLCGRDTLWQKERLLNIAIESLPDDCDRVAWLDCDVVFEKKDWHVCANHLLDQFSLIQLFKERCNLARDEEKDPLSCSHIESTANSIGYKIATREVIPEDLRNSNAPLVHCSTSGLAWAARRDLLEEHTLYDACIIGTGDRAILCAALGSFEYAMDALELTGRRIEHYLAWARPFFAEVGGNVGYLDGRIYHLWHGDLKDRKYQLRHHGFKQFNFDPFTDIAIVENGCWRWNSNKPDMHDYVKTYFEGRNEDGISQFGQR